MATIERIDNPTWRLNMNEREAQLIGSLLGWLKDQSDTSRKLYDIFSEAGIDMSNNPCIQEVVGLKPGW